MKEIWKTIPSHPDYEASTLGNIRRVGGKNNIKPFYDALQEYGRIMIRRKKYMVHTLVAETFLGEKPQGMEIDHLNTNLRDNRPDNLAYVTQEANRNNPITKFNREVSRIRKAITSGKKSQEDILRLVAIMRAAL